MGKGKMSSSDIKNFLTGMMDISFGVNRLEDAKEGLKTSIRDMVISVLVVAAIRVGIKGFGRKLEKISWRIH